MNSKLIIVNPILNLPYNVSVEAVNDMEENLCKCVTKKTVAEFKSSRGKLSAERVLEFAELVTQKTLKAAVDAAMYKYCPGYKMTEDFERKG